MPEQQSAGLPQPLQIKKAELRTAGLAATGALASRFAHDLNNYLTTILGKAELALLARDPERMSAALQAGAEAARKARDLVGQMQRFAAAQRADEAGGIDILDAVRPPLALLSRSFEKCGIVLDRRFSPCQSVVCDLGAVALGVYHVLRNSWEALESHGGWIQVSVEQRGEEIEVRVSDDGPGLPPEVIEAASRPDFADPDASASGLRVAAQVARAHSGRLVAGTRAGGGSVVSLCLPLRPSAS
jgi:signal transduction histidine kinase